MATSTQATTVEVIGNGNTAGTRIGASSTEKLGFYGLTTPIVQPTAVTSVTTTGASSTTNAYGYTTAAQADAIVASLNSVISKLTALGLLAS